MLVESSDEEDEDGNRDDGDKGGDAEADFEEVEVEEEAGQEEFGAIHVDEAEAEALLREASATSAEIIHEQGGSLPPLS